MKGGGERKRKGGVRWEERAEKSKEAERKREREYGRELGIVEREREGADGKGVGGCINLSNRLHIPALIC